MRPVESLLSIANLLTFLVLTLPLPRSVLWIRFFVPIVLLIAIIQLLAEGWRWQMLPAYALSGLTHWRCGKHSRSQSEKPIHSQSGKHSQKLSD